LLREQEIVACVRVSLTEVRGLRIRDESGTELVKLDSLEVRTRRGASSSAAPRLSMASRFRVVASPRKVRRRKLEPAEEFECTSCGLRNCSDPPDLVCGKPTASWCSETMYDVSAHVRESSLDRTPLSVGVGAEQRERG